MHCACAKRPYFHFWSKIWRHHRVLRTRFPLRRENFGICIHLRQIWDYLIFAWVFRTFWPKMGVLWGKIGEGVVQYWPLTNSFFLLGVFTSVPILTDAYLMRLNSRNMAHAKPRVHFIRITRLHHQNSQLYNDNYRWVTREFRRFGD